jgi:hypothetical protein
MNPTDYDSSRVHEIIEKGTAGVIILPANASVDATAAATAIYLALTKMGKNVTIASDTQPKHDITGIDKIQKEISASGDNLVISFPYRDGAIDKVDYNIQGETFNLIITPREQQYRLDSSKVKFTYAGGVIDFIITVDAPNLQSIGSIFTDNKEQFQGKTIINIDRHLVNDFYGTVNMVNKTISSTSELALRFLHEVQAELDKDIATNLYFGITSATNGFSSYSVNADTFEAAAILLKAGAIKKQVQKPQPVQPVQQPRPVQQPQSQQFFPKKNPGQPQHQQQPRNNPPQQQVMSAPKQTAPAPTPAPSLDEMPKPIEDVEQETNAKTTEESSQDWLKPKIFRGTGLI